MIRPPIVATLDDLRRLAGELEEADRYIAAHAIRKGVAVLTAELQRLGDAIPVHVHVDAASVAHSPRVAPYEDDGDPEVFGW